MQDSGVETYLQSQEDETEGRQSPLHGMQAWSRKAGAFVQRLTQQVSLTGQRASSQASPSQWVRQPTLLAFALPVLYVMTTDNEDRSAPP